MGKAASGVLELMPVYRVIGGIHSFLQVLLKVIIVVEKQGGGMDDSRERISQRRWLPDLPNNLANPVASRQ